MKISDFDFCDIYNPLPNPLEPDTDMLDPEQIDLALEADEDFRAWTMIEGANKIYIVPGVHYINRIGYYVTEKPWTDEYLIVQVC